jgi:hypothetical protein
MSKDLKGLFRALDALDFPHGAAPPDVRSTSPAHQGTLARRFATVLFALLIGTVAISVAILAFDGRSDGPRPPGGSVGVTETGPGTCDYGPWIEECREADWARSVVAVSGLEIVREETVLVVGSSNGGEFFFFAKERGPSPAVAGRVESLSRLADSGEIVELRRVDGIPVYRFARRGAARYLTWEIQGLIVELDSRAPLSAPSPDDLVALVRATRSVQYGGMVSSPGVEVPDVVGSKEQQALFELNELGLTWIVSYRSLSGASPWRVASVDPAGGTQVEEGAVIRLLVATHVTPLPDGAADTLDCDLTHREAFGGPDVRILPGGSLYVTGNLPGIEHDDEVVQVTFGDREWEGIWHVIRAGSVLAVVDWDSLDGEACQGSGVAGT